MKREFDASVHELMDMPQTDAAALERDVTALESLNVRFGGHEIVQKFLPLWLRPAGEGGAQRHRILDLATASGDIPRMIAAWARARGIAVEIDAVDFNPGTLAIARRRSAAYPEINYIEADILRFDPGHAAYDIVLCSQAIHHFGEEDAVRVLALCRAASRGRVLVSDLVRRRIGQFAVWLLTATIYRDRTIRYDSRLSVRRAFTPDEFCALARRAGWTNFGYRSFFPVRQAMWLENHSRRNQTEIQSQTHPCLTESSSSTTSR